MLERNTFETVVASTPLISVDFIAKKEGKVLLGKRVNKPAKGYYFTMGGRVFKGEKIQEALVRIAKEELNLTLEEKPRCIGVFEHLYDDSIFEGVSTHYVNFGYEIKVSEGPVLPKEQHSEYAYFDVDELLQREDVHPYVKDYFNGNRIC